MKFMDSIRHIDDLGRIVINSKIRKELDIKEGDAYEIWADEKNNIILKKVLTNKN